MFNFRPLLLLAASTALVSSCSFNSTAPTSQATTPAAKGVAKTEPSSRLEREFQMTRDPRTNSIPRNIRRLETEFARNQMTVEEARSAKGGLSYLLDGPPLLWTSRGPFNISGRTRALAIDVSDSTNRTLIAGGISGGMWRTTDGGTSWRKTTTFDQLHSVTAVAQDRRAGKQNVWYYGTGERTGNSTSGGGATYLGDGIYKSTDSGQTWNVLPSTATNVPQSYDNNFDFVWTVKTDPSATDDRIYAAIVGGIMRSTDGGATWNAVLGNTSNGNFTDVVVTSTGVVYATLGSDAGVNGGVWRSTTGDLNSFTKISPPNFPALFNRTLLAVAPSAEGTVYLLAETPQAGTNKHSIFVYNVANDTWENRSANVPTESAASNRQGFDSQGAYDMFIAVKPDDPNTVIIGGTNLYRSTDGFATQTSTTQIGGYRAQVPSFADYLNHHPDQHGAVFANGNPRIMFTNSDGGVHRTDDITAQTVVWTPLNNGYVTTQYYSVAIDQATSGSNVIIGGLQDRGNFFTNEVTRPAWTEVTGGDGTFTAVANGGSFLYVATQNGNTQRYKVDPNGVRNFDGQIHPTAAKGQSFVNPYILDPNNSEIMYYLGGNVVWRTLNASTVGQTDGWTELNNLVVPGTAKISAIAAAKEPANRLFLGTDEGKVFRSDNANAAATMVEVGLNAGFPAGHVSCIAVDPTDGNRAIVVFSNYGVISIFHTTDGGTTWASAAGNLEQNADGTGNGPSVRWATILPRPTGRAFLVGTSTGVWSTSTLNGTSTVWLKEAINVIGNVVVTMILSRPVDGVVVAATHGAGVYSASSTVPLAAPTLTLIQPATGPVAGGTPVTLNGTNFVNGASVRIGGTLATNVAFVSATQITAVTPAHAAGASNVVVTNPDGQSATLNAAFTFTAPSPAATITSITPTSGTTAGGTNVTIAGTNFGTTATLQIGGGAATNVVVVSGTSITATTPARANAGAVDVVLTTGSGIQPATLVGGFTYLAAGGSSGDADGNNTVGVSDVFYLINTLFTNGPQPVGRADANGDGSISVADIFYLINFLFANGPAPV